MFGLKGRKEGREGGREGGRKEEVTRYFGKVSLRQPRDRSHPVSSHHFPLPKPFHTACKDTALTAARDDPVSQLTLCWHLIHKVSLLAFGDDPTLV